jgi:hypothetical protein
MSGVTASRIERQFTNRLSGQAILKTSRAGTDSERKAERVLLHEPLNWSLHLVPEGKTSLCLQAFVSSGNEAWQSPDVAVIDRALAASGSTSSP